MWVICWQVIDIPIRGINILKYSTCSSDYVLIAGINFNNKKKKYNNKMFLYSAVSVRGSAQCALQTKVLNILIIIHEAEVFN